MPFGLSYALQETITTRIPEIFRKHIEEQMAAQPFGKSCLNLQVEFFQANSSSLDLLVLADFDGQVADIYKRIERALNKWCVDCCSANNWEIPFPQLTLHRAEQDD